MNCDNLLSYIKPEDDIADLYQPVIGLIGLDAFVKLCKYAAGDTLYFPTQQSIFRKARNRKILHDYDGYNVSSLSREFGLTRKQIRCIVKGSTLPLNAKDG